MSGNKLEKFTVVEITRDRIHGAPYNPRKISASAAKKLRESLRTFGMLQPVVWNQQTGNIVAGHQRVEAMDTLLRKEDYPLTVAVVDLPIEDEVRANVVMNNTAVMGEWDTSKLADIKTEFPNIDFEKDLCFDKYDLDLIFADTALEHDVYAEQKPLKDEVERMREIDQIKRAKKVHRHEVTAEDNEGSTFEVEKDDYMVTFVFPNNSEKWEFMTHINEKRGERYVKHTKLYDIQDGKLKAYGKV